MSKDTLPNATDVRVVTLIENGTTKAGLRIEIPGNRFILLFSADEWDQLTNDATEAALAVRKASKS